MTLSTHATIGAVIGAATGNLWIAFFLGIASHFLSDVIPHGDRDMYDGHKNNTARKKALAFITLDGIAAVMIVSLMFASSEHSLNTTIAAGIIGAILPDLIIGFHELFEVRWLNRFNKVHFGFHNVISDRTGDVPLKWALAVQALLIVALQPLF